MRQTKSMRRNLSRLDENRWHNLNMDSQQASINKTLTKNVAFMTSNKKSIKPDGKPVCDTELIYTRVICLQQYRDIDMTDVLSYELSQVPASSFDESGAMRAQSKKVLKTKLQVEQLSRIQ